jgi:hypothetical protein
VHDEAGDDARIVPLGLEVRPHAAGCSTLEVTALTLQAGPESTELYAALENRGDVIACSPSFTVELFDGADQSLAVSVGGLLVHRFYRLTDGSETLAACVAPGDVTMIALTDLPGELDLDQVRHVDYRCSYWSLDITPAGTVDVMNVRAVTREGGEAYTGTLKNRLSVALESPALAVFPVSRAGRPLGIARGNGSTAVPAGGTWDFETETTNASGADHTAFPTHGP